MTPLDAALSRLRDAATSSVCATALSPDAAASRTRRTEVFSADLTDLLRRRAASVVRMRLIWDLILATPDCLHFVGGIMHMMRAPLRRTRPSRLPAGHSRAQIRACPLIRVVGPDGSVASERRGIGGAAGVERRNDPRHD